MTSTITIYRATPKDAPLLSNMGAKTFSDTFGNTCTKEDMRITLDEFFNLNQVIQELNNPKDYFYIASQHDIVKGYCRIKKDTQPPFELLNNYNHIELKRLYIFNEYHGEGIAQALMDKCFAHASAAGCNVMYLSVWEYNFRARGFYEKNGFKNTGIENDFPIGSTPQTDLWFIKYL